MKVLRDLVNGTLTLQPSTDGETAVLKEIQATITPGELLAYTGRSGASPNDPISERMRISFVLNGGTFEIIATSDSDEDPVRWTRDAIFFGGGGLILLGHHDVDGLPALEFTIGRCGICNKPIVSMGECEWKTCDGCKDKCAHEELDRGIIHGGDAGASAVGEFCIKCGRAVPKPEGSRKESQIEKDLAVQRELGIIVLYRDLPFGAGPQDVVQVRRIARGLQRARSRQRSNPSSASA